MRWRLMSLPAIDGAGASASGPDAQSPHMYCLKPRAGPSVTGSTAAAGSSTAPGSGGTDGESAGGIGAGSWELVRERGDVEPPSPALGKLAVESERVALATMVSVLGVAS